MLDGRALLESALRSGNARGPGTPGGRPSQCPIGRAMRASCRDTRFPRHDFWAEQEIPTVLRPNREVLRFGGQAVPMAGGQEGFPKRAHRGGHHDLRNDRNSHRGTPQAGTVGSSTQVSLAKRTQKCQQNAPAASIYLFLHLDIAAFALLTPPREEALSHDT